MGSNTRVSEWANSYSCAYTYIHPHTNLFCWVTGNWQAGRVVIWHKTGKSTRNLFKQKCNENEFVMIQLIFRVSLVFSDNASCVLKRLSLFVFLTVEDKANQEECKMEKAILFTKKKKKCLHVC